MYKIPFMFIALIFTVSCSQSHNSLKTYKPMISTHIEIMDLENTVDEVLCGWRIKSKDIIGPYSYVLQWEPSDLHRTSDIGSFGIVSINIPEIELLTYSAKESLEQFISSLDDVRDLCILQETQKEIIFSFIRSDHTIHIIKICHDRCSIKSLFYITESTDDPCVIEKWVTILNQIKQSNCPFKNSNMTIML